MLCHEYDAVDDSTIERIVENELGPLRQACVNELAHATSPECQPGAGHSRNDSTRNRSVMPASSKPDTIQSRSLVAVSHHTVR